MSWASYYIIQSLAWSCAGLLFGYGIGRAGKDLGETMTEPRARTCRFRLRFDNIAGIVLLVLVIATLGTAITTTVKFQQEVGCQQQLNEANQQLLAARGSSAFAVRRAQLEYLDSLQSPQSFDQGALERYRSALHEDVQQRTANPVPEAEC